MSEASFRLQPPYGCAFRPNADGSIEIVFNLDDIEKIDGWCEEVSNLAKQVLAIETKRREALISPLDRPVELKPSEGEPVPEESEQKQKIHVPDKLFLRQDEIDAESDEKGFRDDPNFSAHILKCQRAYNRKILDFANMPLAADGLDGPCTRKAIHPLSLNLTSPAETPAIEHPEKLSEESEADDASP